MIWRPLAAAGLLAALAWWAGFAFTALGHAAAEYQRTASAAALPRLAAPAGALIAPNAASSHADLARRIGDAGAGAGVRLSLSPLAASDTIDGVVMLRVVARGDEARLLRFSADVEQGATLIRWSRWSILPDGDGSLRLSADAAAPWHAR